MEHQQLAQQLNNIVITKLLRDRQLRRHEESARSSRLWSRDIFLERPTYGFHAELFPKLRESNKDLFFNYTRMKVEQYDFLLSLVEEKLKKQVTHLREPLSPSERLSLCLRFLATGECYQSLSLSHRVGKSTVSQIIPETCKAITEALQPLYMAFPSSYAAWEEIANGFLYRWNFPNCLGAVDGKHVEIKAPPSSGAQFYNYKKYPSIVLMASCDAHYCFTYADIGDYGRNNDAGVFNNCELGKRVLDNKIFPLPKSPPLPYVFIGDEAFGLRPNFLRPYPKTHLGRDERIYNYRLSRARNCIENAFGIMTARWRVLRKSLELAPENCNFVVMACCCLHNFLIKEGRKLATSPYCPRWFADTPLADGQIQEGEWRNENITLESVGPQGSNNFTHTAREVREKYKSYFCNEGAVCFQYRYA